MPWVRVQIAVARAARLKALAAASVASGKGHASICPAFLPCFVSARRPMPRACQGGLSGPIMRPCVSQHVWNLHRLRWGRRAVLSLGTRTEFFSLRACVLMPLQKLSALM